MMQETEILSIFIYFSGNPLCPVVSFEAYLMHLNPECEALWQRPRDFVDVGDNVWYMNIPIGKNTLAAMMPTISRRGQLSRIYTNHSIRATSITTLDECGFESRHIMRVSGHRSEASLKSYAQKVPQSKKMEMSDCLSRKLGQSAVPTHPRATDTVTSAVQDELAIVARPNTATSSHARSHEPSENSLDDLADILDEPFHDNEQPLTLSNSQLNKTIQDLQSSPVPLSEITNTAISKKTVMPITDKVVHFQPSFAAGCVVNINFNYHK